MKQGWNVKKLSEVCEIVGGGTPSKKNQSFYEGDLLWATVRDMKNDVIHNTEFKITLEAVKKSATHIIPRGNIVIATRVGLGKVCLLDQDTAINQDLKAIIPYKQNELSIAYLFHWFKTKSSEIIENGTGATVQGVKLDYINNLRIPLPPLAEQQRIVAILDEAFAAIDAAKANAERNLHNARELFINFLNSIFDDQKEGWEIKTLGDLFDITSSKRVYEAEWKREGVPFYRAREIVRLSRYGFVDNELFISDGLYQEYSEKYGYPKEGDIMVTGVGTLGICYVVKANDKFYFKDGNIIWLKTRGNIVSRFIEYAFKSRYLRTQIDNSIGATVGTFTIVKAKSTKVPVPSIEEQQSIVSQIDEIAVASRQLEVCFQQKVNELDNLKKSILQKAFNGELTEG
ncbi:MAG: restriction endonuclease subunit S [Anaerolineaceae bacterium]